MKHITLGEDSVLELKDIVFGGQKLTDPHRNSFDEQTVPNAKLDDLNPKLWKRFKTVVSPTNDQEFLEKMKLISLDEVSYDFIFYIF